MKLWQLGALCTDTVLSLTSPKLASRFILCTEGEGSLQLSSFPGMFQNKGVQGVGRTAVLRARCGMCGWQESSQPRPVYVSCLRAWGRGKGAGSAVQVCGTQTQAKGGENRLSERRWRGRGEGLWLPKLGQAELASSLLKAGSSAY